MKKEKNIIKCPSCATTLSVDELLINQFKDSVRKDLESELKRREQYLKKQEEEFKVLSVNFEEEKANIEKLVSQKVKSQLKSREDSLKDTIRKEIDEEKVLQLQELEDELNRKSKQLIDLNQTKGKLEKLRREFEEREAKIYLEKEKELNERLRLAKTSIKEEAHMEAFLKIKEKESVIESLTMKLAEAHKRAMEGSIRALGEGQELALEHILRNAHPSDIIDEVKKGANGADCIQTVRLKNGTEAGKIIYESKNTKSWSSSFIKKLKQDNLKTKADVMVIVSKTLPKDTKEKFSLIDGVWITNINNVKDLSLLIRFGVLKTHSVLITQEDKVNKKNLLYSYLTSNEFKSVFESILEGFTSLQNSHQDEQRKMQLLWKRRAKHLEQVLSSTIDFYGSIKGISESSIPTIPMLEIEEVKKAS